MIVGTTEAAKILNISTARLRVLLMTGRVEGAYKTGKMWLMPLSWCAFLSGCKIRRACPLVGVGVAPLFNGKPIIKRGKRGPAPRWRNPKKPAKTLIHVNSQRIRQNHKRQEQQPVITVKTGNRNVYGHQVEIPGGCRVVYRPDSPMCGAKVWIETLHDVKVISFG
jgi:hypothetical protein